MAAPRLDGRPRRTTATPSKARSAMVGHLFPAAADSPREDDHGDESIREPSPAPESGADDDSIREPAYAPESDADDDVDMDEHATPYPSRGSARAASKKGKGGKARKSAPVKPIVSDYDSDDGRIISLKQQGHTDESVAKKLKQERRTVYTSKTVGNRWLRLKKMLERKDEERLDDELSDWHIGEDDKLRNVYLEADEKYEIDVLKLKEKKWKDISAALADKLEVKKYTAPACKARWDALEDGSALLPIELDFDKEGRRVLREDRIAANKQRREDIKAAALWAAGEKDRRAAAKKALMDEKERERQAERARKQAEKDEDDRIKAEIRAGIEEKREKQRAIEAEIKQKLDAKREERKNADAMYVYLTGHKLNGRRDHELIKPKKEDDSDAEMEDWAGDIGAYYEDDEPEMPELNDDPESSVDESDQPKKSVKPGRRSTRTKVTIETLTNPRSVMNLDELDVLNKKRGLRRRDEREPHPEVIARIAVADAALGAKEVKDLLKQHFLNKKGSRDVMVRWLQEADAEGSALGKEGITATSPEFKAGYEGYRGKFAYLLEERSTEME